MSNKINEITSCEVCGAKDIQSVIDLGKHPMCDDLVPEGDTRICREYRIEILFCRNCKTAHQRFQVPKEDLFPSSYHYRSRFTADVVTGMAGLVESCVERFGSMANKKVLDIGCNDGSLLDFFKQQEAITFGIEPTDAYLDAKSKGHITYNSYLSQTIASAIVAQHGSPDIITFTNVFAHIEDLNEMLNSLKILMATDTVIVIENHYLGSVLDGNQFDTFYHEHPRTYSFSSFVHLVQKLETHLLDVQFTSRYGGNIRVFLGNSIPEKTRMNDFNELSIRESLFYEDFTALRKNVKRWHKRKHQFLNEQIKKYGKLRAKAFPGRAAILIKLLGLDEQSISAVYEKPGSLKVGHYLPGTRIPILSDDELFSLQDQTLPLLNLAWHIPSEIRGYLNEHGYKGAIIDILSADDFS